jgi:FKBP-type peptidyl-prolyl cis-trans isomerase
MRTLIGMTAAVGVLAGFVPGEDKAEESDPLHPRVRMETTLGDFVVELDAEKAPITVLNFVRYVEDRFYEGTIFHRVKRDFLIQGGGFTPDLKQKTEGLRPGIKNEWKNGLKNTAGAIAMARRMKDPDSATSQFFINVVDNPGLDKEFGKAGYCVFGKVVEGMDTVNRIRNTPVEKNAKYGRGLARVVPVEPVIIKSARLISEFDRSRSEAALRHVRELQAQAEAKDAKRKKEFLKWLEETKAKAVTTESGLMYHDQVVSDGFSPEPTNKVSVHQTGWLADGTEFENTRERGESASYWLNRMIKGWAEGVGSMKVGGRRTLIIPPELAYGDRERPGFPPNSTLVFDVELLEIVE